MGVISTAIGRYLKDKERYRAALNELETSFGAMRESASVVVTMVKSHGPIEGMGYVFEVEDSDLVVTPVRNCYVVDREIDLSRAAAAYEPAGGAA